MGLLPLTLEWVLGKPDSAPSGGLTADLAG